MLEFLSSNWVWIVFIGAVLWMHFGHGVGHGGHGRCGSHHQPGRGRGPVGTQAEPRHTRRQHEHHEDRLLRSWALTAARTCHEDIGLVLGPSGMTRFER